MRIASAVLASLLAAGSAAAQEPPKPPAPTPAAPAAPKVATDKEADEAIAAFKKDLSAASGLTSGQVAAIQKVGEVKHVRIIQAVAAQLANPLDDVAGTAALTLAKLDHPASAQALAIALPAAEKRPVLASAILRALGQLKYELAAPAINKLIDKSGDDEVIDFMDDLFAAAAQIGSPSSVETLIDFRHKSEGTGRRGGIRGARRGARDMDLVKLRGPCDAALRAITGLDGGTANDWEQAWKVAKSDLMAAAKATWLVKDTWERVEVTAGQKPQGEKGAEFLLVGVRLVDPPQASGGNKKTKKPSDGGDGK